MTATYRFTEKAFLLHHRHAKRTSPLGSLNGTKRTAEPKHSRDGSSKEPSHHTPHQPKTSKTLSLLPAVWSGPWDELLRVLDNIPSLKPVNQQSLKTLLGRCPFAPDTVLGILAKAGARAVSLGTVRDPRAWALRALTVPEFGQQFQSQDMEPSMPPPAGLVAPESPQAAAIHTDLVAHGLGEGGARQVTQSLLAAGVPPDLTPYLIRAADAVVHRRRAKGGVRGDGKGLLVHLLRSLDPLLVAKAREGQQYERQALAIQSLAPAPPLVASAFLAQEGIPEVLAAWASVQDRDRDPEVYLQSRESLLGRVRAFLGPVVVAEILDRVRATMAQSGLPLSERIQAQEERRRSILELLARVGLVMRRC